MNSKRLLACLLICMGVVCYAAFAMAQESLAKGNVRFVYDSWTHDEYTGQIILKGYVVNNTSDAIVTSVSDCVWSFTEDAQNLHKNYRFKTKNKLSNALKPGERERFSIKTGYKIHKGTSISQVKMNFKYGTKPYKKARNRSDRSVVVNVNVE